MEQRTIEAYGYTITGTMDCKRQDDMTEEEFENYYGDNGGENCPYYEEDTREQNVYFMWRYCKWQVIQKKELKEMSTERLIGILVINSSSMTKSSKQTEEKVFMELSDRKVIDYDVMKAEYERIGMW